MTYAVSCREWSVDPAAEVEDPWLAHQLRLGLLDALRRNEEEIHEKHEQERKLDEHEARIDRAARMVHGVR